MNTFARYVQIWCSHCSLVDNLTLKSTVRILVRIVCFVILLLQKKIEIIKIICKFPNSKAPGRDNVNSKILKEISNYIVDPLVYIFDMSFTMGIVPDLPKIAKVVPIYKKVERNLPGNYRPISLLSICDKILEKPMYRGLFNFLEQNSILYEYHFGFRKNHSTVQAIMEVLDNIYEHRDNHEVTMGIYIELRNRAYFKNFFGLHK